MRISLFPREIVRVVVAVLLLGIAAGLTRRVVAAPGAKAAQALSFDVTGRFTALQNGRNIGQAPQVLEAHVILSGARARLETQMRDRPVIYLYASPYLYKLLPQERAGVRWKMPASTRGTMYGGIDWQKALRSPKNIAAELKKRGIKKAGSAKLYGQIADLYTGVVPGNFEGAAGSTFKAWLRRADSLPLRVETRSRTLYGVVTWKNYRRAAAGAHTFSVPRDYSLRDSTGRPRLF